MYKKSNYDSEAIERLHVLFYSLLLFSIVSILINIFIYHHLNNRNKQLEVKNNQIEQRLKDVKEEKLNNNVLITAAHLGNIEGYHLLYEDLKRDVAYYLKNNVELTKVEEDTEVTIEGLENCKIVKSEEGVFYVTTSTPEQIINGMSGTRVFLRDGTPIGFVDALVKGQQLKCLTLE